MFFLTRCEILLGSYSGVCKKSKRNPRRRRRVLRRLAAGGVNGYQSEPAEDDKNPPPLDLDGRETALRSPRLGNTSAPYQYSNFKSESEDTLPGFDGYQDACLDNLPTQQYNSVGEAIGAIKSEFQQLRIKNMAEAEDMLENLSTTVAESKEVYSRQMAENMNCYNKAKAVDDEAARRLAEIRAEAACMLERMNCGEEVSREDMMRSLEKIAEIGQRPVSLLRIA